MREFKVLEINMYDNENPIELVGDIVLEDTKIGEILENDIWYDSDDYHYFCVPRDEDEDEEEELEVVYISDVDVNDIV